MEQMADKINAKVKECGRAVVVVSEGCDVGDLDLTKTVSATPSSAPAKLQYSRL